MAGTGAQRIPLFDSQSSLQFGEACPARDFRWAGPMPSEGVERFGFRSLGESDATDFVAEYFDDKGKSLRKGPPSLRSTSDTDGMDVLLMELVAPPGTVRASLSGRPGATSVLVGPVGRESYVRSPRGSMLSDAVSVPLAAGTGSVLLKSLLLAGEESAPANYAVQFFDESGAEILPVAETSVSPVLGSYVVVQPPAVITEVEVPIPLPAGTRSISVRELKSKPEAAVAVRVSVTPRSIEAESLDAFLQDLGADRPLILIDSTAPPLGSGLITIRPNNLTVQYSSMGYGVISIGYGDLQHQPRRPREFVYQAPRAEFDDVVNRVVDEIDHRPCLYVCSSFPSPHALAAVDQFHARGWKTLYEIRDDMEEFKRVGYSKWYTAESEALICRRVDHVTAVSPALSDKARALSLGVAEPVTIPNGIHERFILKAAPLRTLEVVERKRLEGIIGYVGHLTESWFDWDLVLRCAEELSDRRFEIIGPGKPKSLRLPDNVTYLGPKKQEELQSLTAGWTVGLIPFKKSPLTRGVDPNKLFEYCAWGMRTVSADMGSIAECPTAVAYNTYSEMVAAVKSALDRPWTQSELDSAERFLRDSTWRRRAERTLEVVGL